MRDAGKILLENKNTRGIVVGNIFKVFKAIDGYEFNEDILIII